MPEPDTHQDSFSPSAADTPHPQKNTSFRSIALLLALLLLLSLLWIAYTIISSHYLKISPIPEATAPTTETPVTTTETVTPTTAAALYTFAPLPASTEKRFPISTKESEVQALVSIDPTESPLLIPGKVSWGSGALYLGSSDPLVSPNLSQVAYLTQAGSLIISTTDLEHQVSFPTSFKPAYLSGWSPNSQYLIVHIPYQNFTDPYGGGYGQQTDSFDFDPNAYPTGFYLIDTKAGTLKAIAPLNNFVTWVGPTKILAEITTGQDYNDNHWVLYDVVTGKADYKIAYNSLSGYFGPQVSVSADGSTWGIALHKATESVKIVLAPFPSTTGIQVFEDSFAYSQGPLISPDGKKLLFRKYDVVNGPTYVHLGEGNSQERLVQGVAVRWIDNQQFLYTTMSQDSSTNVGNHWAEVYTYDVSTKKSTLLGKREDLK